MNFIGPVQNLRFELHLPIVLAVGYIDIAYSRRDRAGYRINQVGIAAAPRKRKTEKKQAKNQKNGPSHDLLLFPPLRTICVPPAGWDPSEPAVLKKIEHANRRTQAR